MMKTSFDAGETLADAIGVAERISTEFPPRS